MTDVARHPIPNTPDTDLPPVHAYTEGPATNVQHPPATATNTGPLPHDPDAELALLGAAMLGATTTLAGIPLEAFYNPANAHLAQAITATADEKGRGDAVLVADWLARAGTLDQSGGPGRLAEAIQVSLGPSSADRYAALVLDHWRARRLITAARELETTVRDRGPEAGYALLQPLLEHTAPPVDSRMRDGDWILDAPALPPAVWGQGSDVLWAQGEPCLVTGPPGVGKTTLVGQLVHARVGLSDQVLGYPVTRDPGRVLYLASDRPEQIRRALARRFGPEDRAHLKAHLKVWPGPPPTDLAKDTGTLVRMANQAGATTVILDSLKDMALGLADDEVGAGLNQAMQLALAEGIDVLALHHQRKGTSSEKRPKTLEDLYGSTWIAAGAGSILLLWGKAGDLIVEMHHLKQPAADVGPLKLEHDHTAGTTVVHEGYDVLAHLRHAPHGLTSSDSARAWLGKDPSPNDRKKAQRRLDALVDAGHATRKDSARQEDGTVGDARWFAVDKRRDDEPEMF